jgi:hypothetical protein
LLPTNRLDHQSFAVYGPIALLGNAFYPVLVYLALMQLHFTSFDVICLRRDFHPQECVHAGRTRKNPAFRRGSIYSNLI